MSIENMFMFKAEDFIFHGYPPQMSANACAAAIANRVFKEWLENQPVVYGHVKDGTPNYWGPLENGKFKDTHTARLVCIEPIQKDTAESLLKEYLVEYDNFKAGRSDNISVKLWVERAKKLLADK